MAIKYRAGYKYQLAESYSCMKEFDISENGLRGSLNITQEN